MVFGLYQCAVIDGADLADVAVAGGGDQVVVFWPVAQSRLEIAGKEGVEIRIVVKIGGCRFSHINLVAANGELDEAIFEFGIAAVCNCAE